MQRKDKSRKRHIEMFSTFDFMFAGITGRLDGTAYFRPLVQDDIRKIAVMALNALAVRVADASGGRLELRPHSTLIDVAVQGSLKMPQYGARGVQRAVQRNIAVPLSKYALFGPLLCNWCCYYCFRAQSLSSLAYCYCTGSCCAIAWMRLNWIQIRTHLLRGMQPRAPGQSMCWS